MTLVSSGVSTQPVDQHAELSDRRHCWRAPRWLQHRREADELARWATDVSGEAEAPRLAAGMDVPMVSITSCVHGWIKRRYSTTRH
jgi:hypothetical protein